MVASVVLGQLATAGIRLRAEGERLFAEPREVLTDELRAAIRANKPALLTALSVPCPEDLRARIWDMARQWGYSPEELAYALQKAAEDPLAWRKFVADDEQWCATKN